MEPKLPKIKPNIQPNKIVRGNRGSYGGVKSKGLNPLVRNITDSDNLFSKMQDINPEVRNKRGTRTLFNMIGTFGTERNEKIIRRNLQLLRNTLVETFEIAKLLRMNAASGSGGAGLAIAGAAGLGGLAGYGLAASGGLEKMLGLDEDDKKEDKELADKEKEEVDVLVSEAEELLKNKEEYDESKLDSNLEESSNNLIERVSGGFNELIMGLNRLVKGEGIVEVSNNKTESNDNKLEVVQESEKTTEVDDLVSGIKNSFKDQLKTEIKMGESNNDYGAMYSRDRDTFDRGDEDITGMTISELDQLQTDYINHQKELGYDSSEISAAMGAYQMLNPLKVAEEMGLDPETTVFNKDTQDMMADYYLNYAGLKEFQAGEITAEEFNNRLAEQFASIETTSGEGVYDDDGINKANTNILELIKSQESKYKDLSEGILLKGKGKGEVIIIDNSKEVQPISPGGSGKATIMTNSDPGRAASSGPTLAFLSSSNSDASNISTKSIIGLMG